MKCPHCLVDIHPQLDQTNLGKDSEDSWLIEKFLCPSCKKFFFSLHQFNLVRRNSRDFLVYPKASGRPPCPKEVPPKYSEDYKEACLVLADSPKASAALSRRCLQNILREHLGIKEANLAKEIEEFINRPDTPSYISEAVDAVRNIGNFAAHTTKSVKSGEIIDVEPGEAEWNLEVLESLFDFLFVQPNKLAERKAKLEEKLKDAGKKK